MLVPREPCDQQRGSGWLLAPLAGCITPGQTAYQPLLIACNREPLVSCGSTQPLPQEQQAVSRQQYTVRLGDDGASKAAFDTLDEALAWAADYSLTNWAGKAQVRENGYTVARFMDGVQVS